MADELVHLAVASDGTWPNWALCRGPYKRPGRRVPLTGDPAKATCPACLCAAIEAYDTAQQRLAHARA